MGAIDNPYSARFLGVPGYQGPVQQAGQRWSASCNKIVTWFGATTRALIMGPSPTGAKLGSRERGETLSVAQPTPFRVVVMPAYQAERTLRKTVADLPVGCVDHVLVVDDFSLDQTVSVARSMGLDVRTRASNGGYGANQKTCYEAALDLGATVVALLHPDYQYDPRVLPELIAPIVAGEADMTFGSRFAGRADPRVGGMPGYRYYGNRVTTWAENCLLGTRFTETHSGMRAYSRKVLTEVPLASFSDDFVFDTQMLVAVHRLGFRIKEVPIPTRYTLESSSINIHRSLVYVAQSIRECWRFHQGRRDD